jgi:hypothetical protein
MSPYSSVTVFRVHTVFTVLRPIAYCPELSLSRYPPKDLVLRPAFQEA